MILGALIYSYYTLNFNFLDLKIFNDKQKLKSCFTYVKIINYNNLKILIILAHYYCVCFNKNLLIDNQSIY